MTDRVDINRLLGDMRSLKAQTQAFQLKTRSPAAPLSHAVGERHVRVERQQTAVA